MDKYRTAKYRDKVSISLKQRDKVKVQIIYGNVQIKFSTFSSYFIKQNYQPLHWTPNSRANSTSCPNSLFDRNKQHKKFPTSFQNPLLVRRGINAGSFREPAGWDTVWRGKRGVVFITFHCKLALFLTAWSNYQEKIARTAILDCHCGTDAALAAFPSHPEIPPRLLEKIQFTVK